MTAVLRAISLMCLITAGVVVPASAVELVVAAFGGTFVENSKKCHAAAFEKATGSSVKYVLGSSVQTMAELRAGGGAAGVGVGRRSGRGGGEAAGGGGARGVRRRLHGQPDRQAGEGRGPAPAARARQDWRLGRSVRCLAGQGRLLGV